MRLSRKLDDQGRLIALEGAFNIRDLGGYRLQMAGQFTQARRVLRADSPHRLTHDDLDILLDTGLRRVIDLRAPHEVQAQPNPLGALDGIDYLHLPLFDALSPAHLQGGRGETNPLVKFYARTLLHRQPQIRAVLEAIAEAPDGAVLFHCTAGKDRTGLIAALVLGHAGVMTTDIVADYARTAPLISPLVAEFLNLAAERGEADLDAYRRVLTARPETMQQVLALLAAEYGSASDYLSAIGMDRTLQHRLAERMVAG